MKAIFYPLLWLFVFMKPSFAQIVPSLSEDCSVVYFLRGQMNEKFNPSLLSVNNIHSNLTSIRYDGANTNMKVFYLYDNKQLIGRLDTNSYFRYECKAGNHLFWSRGKTNDFVEAELAAGKIYFIDVLGQTTENSPDIRPVFTDNEIKIEGILNFIASQPERVITQGDIKRYQIKMEKKIEKELYRYSEDKRKGKYRNKLTRDMYY